MTTLTKSTGTVALSGAVEKVTFPAVYGWVWVKNMSDSDMFVSLSEDISAGADGVLAIPAGECGRIQTDGQDSVYLMGTGNALVVAQNYADCPFKFGGKGGESPDLSLYAKKSDVPNIKVNSAVNSDTVNGKNVEMATYTNLSSFGVSGTDTADTIWQAIPDGSIYVDKVQNLTDTSWNFPSGVNESTIYITKMSKHRIAGMYLYPKTGGDIYCGFVAQDGSFSGNWRKLAKNIKSVTATASTDANAFVTLPNNSSREYISVIPSDCIAIPFDDTNSGERKFIAVDTGLAKKPNTSITFTAYYYDK